jgi:hypothetical protein
VFDFRLGTNFMHASEDIEQHLEFDPGPWQLRRTAHLVKNAGPKLIAHIED